MYLAARRLDLALPENPPWWYLFDVTEHEIMLVAKEIQELYSLPKPEFARLDIALAAAAADDAEKERSAAVQEEIRPRAKRRGWDR